MMDMPYICDKSLAISLGLKLIDVAEKKYSAYQRDRAKLGKQKKAYVLAIVRKNIGLHSNDPIWRDKIKPKLSVKVDEMVAIMKAKGEM